MKSSVNLENIKKTLSEPRLSTYEKQTDTLKNALDLYRWNAQVSSALFDCIAMCEVVLRNAVSEAICSSSFGDKWVWNTTFAGHFPLEIRQTLHKLARKRKIKTLDRAIPELTFIFWQSVLTSRFDNNIWNDNLFAVFPNVVNSDVAVVRQAIYTQMGQVRSLRNRIAHHETITKRDLQNDFETIVQLINYRCTDTANWLMENQQVTHLLANRPKV